MDLHASEEQEALRRASAEWLADHLPLARARNRAAGHWRAMAEMGWFGITSSEATGGLGLDHATEALVFAELGRVVGPIGALAAAVVGKWAGDLAPGFLSGTLKPALGLDEGHGETRVLDAAEATHIVVLSGQALALHKAPSIVAEPGFDPSQQQARLETSKLGALLLAANDGAQFSHLQLLSAAYALGAADVARDMAAAYATLREQFGRPIGSFQGVKHPCADMAVRAYAARAQLLYAACALDAGAADAAFHVNAAKRLCDQAALENARSNIQVHGGIGMTDEANPHLLLKRAHVLQFIAPSDTAQILG